MNATAVSGTEHNGIATGMAWKKPNLNLPFAEMQIDTIDIQNRRTRESLDYRLEVLSRLLADQAQVLGMNPRAHVMVREDAAAGVRKNAVPANMIAMVVGVDDELYRSFVCLRISASNSLAALADAKPSITAMPSLLITKPPFAPATPFAAGSSIAATRWR